MKIANNEITESQLRESVMQHLGWFPGAVSKDMGVSFSDGIVTLTGVVDTYAERLAAEHAVKALYGVKGIANEIQVRQLSTLNDTDIARNAVHAIARLKAGSNGCMRKRWPNRQSVTCSESEACSTRSK
jgi:osmotically-inducible protein OsmY